MVDDVLRVYKASLQFKCVLVFSKYKGLSFAVTRCGHSAATTSRIYFLAKFAATWRKEKIRETGIGMKSKPQFKRNEEVEPVKVVCFKGSN